jgi:DnaD/phage-associated family protein
VTRPFGGFQLSVQPGISIPRSFFLDILPQLADVSEIQTTLCLFRLIDESGGLERPVAEDNVIRDSALRKALRVDGSPNEPDRRINAGLDLAVGRGTFLKVAAVDGTNSRVWYYVNTVANQVTVAALARGSEVPPRDLWLGDNVPAIQPERPSVFRLYEQNIGLLTPLIAEHLIDALETYPQEWISDAIAEAVAYNRRSWRYVNRILENWAVSGRTESSAGDSNHEAYRRGDSRDLDPNQYKHGRHLDRAKRR